MTKAIDLFINPNFATEQAGNELTAEVNSSYFKRGDDFFKDCTIEGLLCEMDSAGVEHGVLTINPESPPERILEFSRKHPDRFSLCPFVDVNRMLDAVWAVEDLVRDENVSMVRVMPSFSEKPPTHPYYYPLYAKCVERDLPISIFTGIPGPILDAECQNPIYLDRVCRDFPALRIIMTHGADPWWGVAIRLMIKYQNLYLMTSAWKPKYLPDELLDYMNTRGRDKIMWSSDHPVLDMTECLGGVADIEDILRPGVLENYLYQNAKRVVLGERKPARETPS
ncbi:MAG: amidohydrolase family protein [Rhodospirillaceae bacterium]|nr:amidohydrolase family protein [Rhodospirillaceae bacterium]